MTKNRREDWSKLIAEQEACGESARGFCRRRGIGEHSFYQWRRKLRKDRPVQFALLENETVESRATPAIELTLRHGECLRIYPGVDAATLRVVLDAVRQ